MVARILAHYEALWDIQMLATVVCVLSSASQGGGSGALLPQEEDYFVAYERYLTRYAELLFLWGSHPLHVDVLNHLQALKDRAFEARTKSASMQPLPAKETTRGVFPTPELAEVSTKGLRHTF